jgi:hypothetical protein
MARQGLRELRAAFYPESNVAQPAEYGSFGTKTPGEVAEDRRGESLEHDDEKPKEGRSILGNRMREAEGRDGRGHDDKSPEPERE